MATPETGVPVSEARKGVHRREHAIRLHYLNHSAHGGSGAIQVPEPDLRDDFVAVHERDSPVIGARDFCLCVGHGDGGRPVESGSELDSRGHAAATLIGVARSLDVGSPSPPYRCWLAFRARAEANVLSQKFVGCACGIQT